MAKYQNYKQKSKAKPVSEEKGKAQKGPEQIRKKSIRIPKSAWITALVVVIIAALIVVWVGAVNGWFPEKNDAIGGEMTLESYNPLEIDRTKVEVTDETLENIIQSELNEHAETQTLDTGKVENGDVVNIDYKGTLASTGETFDGGSAEKYDLTIGSGTFIEGFESGLVGKEIGSTVTLDLTFPKDYKTAEVAGQPVKFEVKINSAQRKVAPELNDAFAKEFAEDHNITDAPEPIETVDQLKAYLRQTQYDSNLENAIVEAMNEKETITSYDEEKEALIKPYIQQQFESTASSYGMDAAQLAQLYGSESEEAYVQQQTEQTLGEIMWIDQVIKDQNISWTGVQFDQNLKEYMESIGDTTQTVKEFKAAADPAWMYIYKNLEFKYGLVMDVLKPMVQLVEPKEETEETTEGAETESESASEAESESASEAESESASEAESESSSEAESQPAAEVPAGSGAVEPTK